MPFIAFEGLDGSGKSSLMNTFCDDLRGRGKTFVKTREPGGTPLAEDIRNLILRIGAEVPHARTEVLLMEAARAQHVEGVIRPALARGEWVICDRFAASTVSFQCFARSLQRSDIDWLNHYATAGLVPDLYVLLDLPVEVASQRMQSRAPADRMEIEKKDFHERVRQGYISQAQQSPQGWLILDGQKNPDELFLDLQNGLRSRGWL